MSELFRFYSKRRLKLSRKYLGKSPCEECLMQATGCYSEGINEYRERYRARIEVHLANPCPEGISWFKAAEVLATFILFLIKQNSPVLKGGPEEVKKACFKIRKALALN
jgi:hypothetical protein